MIANLVTKDDFNVQPYNLPDVTRKEASFNAFITDYQEKLLRLILGHALYAEFDAGAAVDPPDPKWVNLRSGTTYLVGDELNLYGGLKPLVKLMVFYQWIRASEEVAVSTGNVGSKHENADRVSPNRRIVGANIELVNLIGDACLLHDTFYGFMNANREVYTSWKFRAVGRLNTHNL
jgi:hypothetical protein